MQQTKRQVTGRTVCAIITAHSQTRTTVFQTNLFLNLLNIEDSVSVTGFVLDGSTTQYLFGRIVGGLLDRSSEAEFRAVRAKRFYFVAHTCANFACMLCAICV